MMNNTMQAVLDYRLDIDPEFQGWALLFATVTALYCFCLPCACAGLSCVSARAFARWTQQRLPAFYMVMTVFNAVFLFLVCTWLPDWTPAQYAKIVLKDLGWTAEHLLKFASSIVMIIAFVIAVAFRERIFLTLGIDSSKIIKCKVRDCVNCFSTSHYRPIALTFFKIDDLASADIFAANNVFINVQCGYNEDMRTRVHNHAGSACVMKETLQMNFDEDDLDESLILSVKSQRVVGSKELGRLELKGSQLLEIEGSSRKAASDWRSTAVYREEHFVKMQLLPRGHLYFRIDPVRDDESEHRSMREMATC